MHIISKKDTPLGSLHLYLSLLDTAGDTFLLISGVIEINLKLRGTLSSSTSLLFSPLSGRLDRFPVSLAANFCLLTISLLDIFSYEKFVVSTFISLLLYSIRINGIKNNNEKKCPFTKFV